MYKHVSSVADERS